MPMRLRTIDAHAAGATLRLVIEGFPTVKGRSMRDKQRWIARHADTLRTALLSEPRGFTDASGAVLTEPVTPGAAAGVIFMHGGGYSAMCGHGLIAAVTIAIERGLLDGVSADGTAMSIDTVAGPVRVRCDIVEAEAGTARRVERVRYRSQPVRILVPGVAAQAGPAAIRADVVWADGVYALVDAESAGVPVTFSALPELRRAARGLSDSLRPAIAKALGVTVAVEGIVLTAPSDTGRADLRVVTVYGDLSVDRSPSGGGTASALAVLSAMGLVGDGQVIALEGLSGLSFRACVAGRTQDDGAAALDIEVEGSAYITGEHTFELNDDDPLRHGIATDGTPVARLS